MLKYRTRTITTEQWISEPKLAGKRPVYDPLVDQYNIVSPAYPLHSKEQVSHLLSILDSEWVVIDRSQG